MAYNLKIDRGNLKKFSGKKKCIVWVMNVEKKNL